MMDKPQHIECRWRIVLYKIKAQIWHAEGSNAEEEDEEEKEEEAAAGTVGDEGDEEAAEAASTADDKLCFSVAASSRHRAACSRR